MGKSSTSLGRTLGRQPERSVSETNPSEKDRSNVDSLTRNRPGRAGGLAAQLLHVFKHVDIEKLRSEATLVPNFLYLVGNRPVIAFSVPSLLHAKLGLGAKQSLRGVR